MRLFLGAFTVPSCICPQEMHMLTHWSFSTYTHPDGQGVYHDYLIAQHEKE